MTTTTLGLAPYSGLRLVEGAVSVPALASHLRPALVLGERQTSDLLRAVEQTDVHRGGILLANAAGIQVWSGPWDGPGGTAGSARLLGSVDWSYDVPSRNYAIIYRVTVTPAGVEAVETTASILGQVLTLAGVAVESSRLAPARPPVRDPFRAHRAS